MPRYDYECETCGAIMEIEHSIHEPARTSKPHWPPGCSDLATAHSDEPLILGAACAGPLKRLLSAIPGNVVGGTPRHYR